MTQAIPFTICGGSPTECARCDQTCHSLVEYLATIANCQCPPISQDYHTRPWCRECENPSITEHYLCRMCAAEVRTWRGLIQMQEETTTPIFIEN